MKTAFLEAGKVRNTHALRGEVTFECWLGGENPLAGIRRLFSSPKGEVAWELGGYRRHGEIFLLSFRGIDSIEKASFLKGKILYVAREDVDPEGDKVFFADLLGLSLVEAENGQVYGKIVDVMDRGGGDLFLIALPDGRKEYFPVVKEWIVKMDPETGVFVHAPEGIFD